MKLTTLYLDSGGEMIRLGFGRNLGRWFIRLDLWKRAWRVTWE